MRCARCDTELDRDMLFCPECGYPVEDEPVPDDDGAAAGAVQYDTGAETALVAEEAPYTVDEAPYEEDVYAPDPGELPYTEDVFAPDPGDALYAEYEASIRYEEREDIMSMGTRTSPPTRIYDPYDEPDAATRVFGYSYSPDDNFDIVGSGDPRGAGRSSFRGASDASGQRWASIPELFPEPGIVPDPGRASGAKTPYGDGYHDGTGSTGKAYTRVSAGKKAASVLLCIFMVLILLFTALAGAVRLTLTDDNIRSSATGDKLAHKSVISEQGVIASTEYIKLLTGVNSIDDRTLREFLSKSGVADLIGDLMTDYSGYVLNGDQPAYLNAEYIADKLREINAELAEASGSDIMLMDPDTVTARINGGDLSFLSIDSEGGYFKQSYGVSPDLMSTLGSLPVLIICGAMVLLFAVLIMIINSSNSPFGLRCNAVAMLTVGIFYLVTAGGMVILSLIKDIWIVSDMLRYGALWLGVIGVGIFAVGVVCMAVAGALGKRARRSPEEEFDQDL